MFRQILSTHLKWTRGALVTVSIIAFVLPAFIWRAVHEGFFERQNAMEVMRGFEALGPGLVVLSILCGIIFVSMPWSVDSQGRHVYALSLPIPWKQYVSMRFSAGAILMLVPAVTLWLGCLFVLAMVELPDTLHAYPGTLAARFLLGGLVAYSITFALQYLSGKRAAHLLLGVLLGITLLIFFTEFVGLQAYTRPVFYFFLRSPGPLAIFAEPWMLIDV